MKPMCLPATASHFPRGLALCLALVLILPPAAIAQDASAEKPFKQEELDQLLAPIALYPDSLLAQILMASTYPLEVVTAARWAKQNESLKGDALTKALEQQNWDPSVKSLINFNQVLQIRQNRGRHPARWGSLPLRPMRRVTAPPRPAATPSPFTAIIFGFWKPRASMRRAAPMITYWMAR